MQFVPGLDIALSLVQFRRRAQQAALTMDTDVSRSSAAAINSFSLPEAARLHRVGNISLYGAASVAGGGAATGTWTAGGAGGGGATAGGAGGGGT